MKHERQDAKVTMDGVEDTLGRAARGDHGAFAEIVREHQSMVFGIARNFLRDPAVAEELAQDVFLELYRNLGSIQSAQHLTFWLRRVTSNRCVDEARRRKVRPEVATEALPELAAAVAPGDPLLARSLGRCVGTLPAAARMVVVLRYQEDLEPAEIADLLGMPVNTVKSHLKRSLALLRVKMTRCLGEVTV